MYAKHQLSSMIRSVSRTPHPRSPYMKDIEGSWLESWRMWSSLTSSSTPEIILITDPESFRSIAPCRAHLWGVEILARMDGQTHGWKHKVTYRGGTHLKKEPYKHSFNMLEHVFMSLNLVIAFNHPKFGSCLSVCLFVHPSWFQIHNNDAKWSQIFTKLSAFGKIGFLSLLMRFTGMHVQAWMHSVWKSSAECSQIFIKKN